MPTALAALATAPEELAQRLGSGFDGPRVGELSIEIDARQQLLHRGEKVGGLRLLRIRFGGHSAAAHPYAMKEAEVARRLGRWRWLQRVAAGNSGRRSRRSEQGFGW